jgi:hypothetical protein
MGRADDSRLTDLRLYRWAFVPALVAFVTMMFSLQGVPDADEPVAPTGAYEGDQATAVAREILRVAPERAAGSEGDAAVANLVAERFRAIPAGSFSEQSFTAELDGDETELANVLVTLPGDPNHTIAVIASRDAPRGEGAASSAAATGVLVELAETLGVAGHDSTFVLASTTAGIAGAEAFVEELPSRSSIDALIVVSQPGVADPDPPYALITSTGTHQGSVALHASAEAALESQVGESGAGESGFEQLARLAFPSGLGEQAPLVEEGLPAVRISAAGERALAPSADESGDLSGETVDAFGRTVHSLVGSLDLGRQLEPNPGTYLEVSGNLVPGWTLSLLALALLLPGLVAAVDACARVARRGGALPGGAAWGAARALPFIGALGTLYALATIGVVPRPEFPFDPGEYPLGARGVVSIGLMLIVGGASAYALRRFGVTGTRAPGGSVAALGAIAAGAGLLLWLANPYAALLAVPAAHVWLVADGTPRLARATLTALGAVLSVVPVVLALGAVSAALELGGDAPWTLTLMVADGQIGFAVVLAGCFLGGSLAGATALAIGGGGLLPAPFMRSSGPEPESDRGLDPSDDR